MIESIVMGIIIGKLFAYVFAGSFFLVLGKLAKEIGVMAIENWPYTILFIIAMALMKKYGEDAANLTIGIVLGIPLQICYMLWNSFLFAPIRAIWKIISKTADLVFGTIVKIYGKIFY